MLLAAAPVWAWQPLGQGQWLAGNVNVLADLRDHQVVVKVRNRNDHPIKVRYAVSVEATCSQPSGEHREVRKFPPYGGLGTLYVNRDSENSDFLELGGFCHPISIRLDDIDFER